MTASESSRVEPLWEIVHGDCLDVLREWPSESVHAIVTDPPYGLSDHDEKSVRECLATWLRGEEYRPKKRGFMARTWDAWVPGPEVWRECLRILKPGGHLLVFAGTRSQDLMGMAIRLAGFQIRDSKVWLYGQGFPKSTDISKAIDKAAGAERRVVGQKQVSRALDPKDLRVHNYVVGATGHAAVVPVTEPATPGARIWDGWGTALKPSHEPIIVARKPFPGSIAKNVLKHGTGALNIEACRIPAAPGDREDYGLDGDEDAGANRRTFSAHHAQRTAYERPQAGRWPANVLLSHSDACQLAGDTWNCNPSCPVGVLDAQSGDLKSGKLQPHHKRRTPRLGHGGVYGDGLGNAESASAGRSFGGSSGGASRFFAKFEPDDEPPFLYCAKASRSERDAGLDGRCGHPTVKPLKLMRWLCRLACPPGGLIVDPFAGSGTTIAAAVLEGFDAYGIEQDAEYVEVARKRVAHWAQKGEAK